MQVSLSASESMHTNDVWHIGAVVLPVKKSLTFHAIIKYVQKVSKLPWTSFALHSKPGGNVHVLKAKVIIKDWYARYYKTRADIMELQKTKFDSDYIGSNLEIVLLATPH